MSIYLQENLAGYTMYADHSMICKWIQDYTAKGGGAFEKVKEAKINMQRYI